MSRVLLTGASGFIGRHCLALLAAHGHEVHAVAHRKPAGKDFAQALWHPMDLLEPGGPAGLVQRTNPDLVLHLAWYAVPGKYWNAPENQDWVRASLELVGACAARPATRLVSAGSCAEYGLTAGECSEESTPLSPSAPYPVSKGKLGARVLEISRQSGLSAAWARIFFLYGPHEDPTRPVAFVVRALLQGEPAPCSEGKQLLDYLHVEDVASALVTVLESEIQGAVNVGSGVPATLRKVFETIGEQLGRSELLQFGARPGPVPPYRLWANTRRLNQELGWAPRFNLASGIENTIEWWRRSAQIPASLPRER